MMCAGWIRFRASLMATRRISWIDQRINDGVAPFLFLLLPWSGVPFFWRRRIGAMADHRHHGEGEHDKRNVAMPAMPGSALVVIESELVLRGLKTVLDRPPVAFDRHQRFDGCSCRTPGGEEGEIAIGDMTTDQQTACPKTVICAVKFFNLEIGQFEIAPIMQPRSFGSSPCRQAFPLGRGPPLGDVRGRAGNRSPLAPGSKYMSAADPEYIAFACFA